MSSINLLHMCVIVMTQLRQATCMSPTVKRRWKRHDVR